MYFEGNRLVVSPSDLVAHLLCAHVTELSLDVAQGRRPRPETGDPELDVVQERGIEHERAYLRALRDEDAAVVEIDAGPFEEEVRQTLAVLAQGPEVIYQAAFFDESGDGAAWRGHADFLRRTSTSSALGDHSYEPYDTKLARHVKPDAVDQLCAYAAQLARLQDTEPERVHVVLGGSEVVTLRLADFAAYHRRAKGGFEAAVTDGAGSYPLPNSHCPVCPYHDDCEERWRLDDHLVRVAGLGVEQARRLEAAGIATAKALAELDGDRVPRMAQATLDKLRQQARLQRATAPGTRPAYELLEAAGEGLGLGALPAPSAGDLFFDIESDPFVGTGGIEYLLGVGWAEADGAFSYRAFWSHDGAGEKQSFEAFVDFVMARRAAHPDLHVFHFAPYETSAVGRLMGRYGTREPEVDDLFRAGVFVDLHRVVRQSVRVGTPSYSLKQLEALYMEDRRSGAIVDAGSSIVEYERWLQDADLAVLQAIEDYNRTDCDSTRQLREWREARRGEYSERFGTEPPRRAVRDGASTGGVEEESSVVAALATTLALAGDSDADAASNRLLAHLLEWHWREAKPEWWKYFRRVEDFDEADLFEDTECVAGLEYLGPGKRVRRSVVHRYRFDPTQEHKFVEGDHPFDPDRERAKARGDAREGPGTIDFLDDGEGVLGLIRGERSNAAHPPPSFPLVPSRRPSSAGRSGDSPRASSTTASTARVPIERPGLSSSACRRAGRARCKGHSSPRPSVPPTWRSGSLPTSPVGASASRGHRARGRRTPPLGSPSPSSRQERASESPARATASSRTCCATSETAGVVARCSQRADAHQGHTHPAVTVRRTPKQVEEDLAAGCNLIAGTSWLFSRESFYQALDWLIIDEAGQLAVSRAQALAIVIASPLLLSVRCNTVEQLRLANGLCRLVELAREC